MSTHTRTVRGLLGTKLGMTQLWDDDNRVVPVTVIAAGTNVVTQVRKPETDGYSAVQVGFGEIPGRKVTKPQAGHFAKAGVTPRRRLVEIRTDDAASYEPGQELSPDLFTPGEQVDVTATSKGKGFAGVMKRHGFHGVGASHGAHRNHRKPGSIGGCATPSRVFKGLQDGRPDGRRHRDHPQPDACTPSTSTRVCCCSSAPSPARGAAWSWSAAASRPRRGRRRDEHRRTRRGRQEVRHDRAARRDLRRPGQHPADPPGRRGPAGGRPRRAPPPPRPAAEVARRRRASPTGRRAPAGPARARSGPRSSPAAAWCTARIRARTTSGRRRR